MHLKFGSRMLKKRDSNIEAYRCFLMFGIVALHCAYVTLGSFTRENNMWYVTALAWDGVMRWRWLG